MMKRKSTPKPKPSARSTSTPSRTNSTTDRSRVGSVASRRPTPVSSHEGSRGPKSAPTNDDDEDVDDLYRVRSFTTRTGVVVNRGDSFKRRGPRSDRVNNDDSTDSLPGPHTGKFHPPPASASFPAQQPADDPEQIPRGTGRIVRQFVDTEECTVPRSAVDGPKEPPPPPLRPALAAAGDVGRKGRHPSVGDAGREDSNAPPVYKVLVLGSQGVGKKTLTKQLLSSEYYSSDCNNAEERDEETVTVQLDDEESVIQFVDSPGFDFGKSGPTGSASENRFDARQGSRDFGKMSSYVGDGFLVVYSVTDRGSFRFAQSCLQELRPAKRHNAVILVANKHDLVRNRLVPETEGIKLAMKRHCKFIEVSALLDHRLDELLVGIVRQIRLRQTRNSLRPEGPMAIEGKGTASRFTETIGNFFQKIFKKDQTTSGKCEDLMAP